MMAQNIVALKAALEHVKNPKARASLEKNIDKSYAKLAEKLDKIEKHLAKKEEKEKKEQEDSTTAETTPVDETTPAEKRLHQLTLNLAKRTLKMQ